MSRPSKKLQQAQRRRLQVVRMFTDGMSISAIAKEIGVSRTRVSQLLDTAWDKDEGLWETMCLNCRKIELLSPRHYWTCDPCKEIDKAHEEAIKEDQDRYCAEIKSRAIPKPWDTVETYRRH